MIPLKMHFQQHVNGLSGLKLTVSLIIKGPWDCLKTSKSNVCTTLNLVMRKHDKTKKHVAQWFLKITVNTFWNSIKILKYLKAGIIAKSSSTTYHGNVSLLQQQLSSQTLHHLVKICKIFKASGSKYSSFPDMSPPFWQWKRINKNYHKFALYCDPSLRMLQLEESNCDKIFGPQALCWKIQKNEHE